ncbi:MAG: hypothetical protein D6748_08045 [Calditrichaeota bacterium]|nr:MAG: hypothetical protein D6748_08045 [Calditrichota bacterium]
MYSPVRNYHSLFSVGTVKVLITLFCVLLLGGLTILGQPVEAPPSTSLLLEKLLNPKLNNISEILTWQRETPHRIEILQKNYHLDERELQLVHNLQNLLQDFQLAESNLMGGDIYWAFLQKRWQEKKLIQISQQAFWEIQTIFEEKLHLKPVDGIYFVLVMEKPRPSVSTSHEAGYTLRGSRFIVMYYSYYTLHGTSVPDFEGFYQTIKHEFVHAFINSSSEITRAINLPGWFHEMVALRISNNPRIRFRGETISRLPPRYQTYYDAGAYLYHQFGEELFYDFVRESIQTGNPDSLLQAIYNINSFAELKRLSQHPLLKLAQKINFYWDYFSQHYQKEKSYLAQLIFISLGLLLVAVFFYSAVRSNLLRIGEFRTLYQEAKEIFEAGSLVQALDYFHLLKEKFKTLNYLEIRLTGATSKLEWVDTQMQYSQEKLITQHLTNIEAERNLDILQAEAFVFELEELAQEKFEPCYQEKTYRVLDKIAPAIIESAWEHRLNHMEKVSNPESFLEPLTICLDYFVAHRTSRYFPESTLQSIFIQTIQQWVAPYHIATPIEQPCRTRQLFQKVVRRLKKYRLHQFDELVEASLKKLNLYCKYEEIEVILSGSRDEFELQILMNMFCLVDIYHSRPDLTRTVLEGIYMILSPETFPFNLVDQFDRILLFIIIKEVYKELVAILRKFG